MIRVLRGPAEKPLAPSDEPDSLARCPARSSDSAVCVSFSVGRGLGAWSRQSWLYQPGPPPVRGPIRFPRAHTVKSADSQVRWTPVAGARHHHGTGVVLRELGVVREIVAIEGCRLSSFILMAKTKNVAQLVRCDPLGGSPCRNTNILEISSAVHAPHRSWSSSAPEKKVPVARLPD